MMNAKTLKALRGSIAKWEGIVAGTMVDERSDNCPLCKMFETCDGCPVMERTGHPGCCGSPYYDTDRAAIFGLDSPEYKAAAQRELDFLKSLLPQAQVSLTTGQGSK